jgi:multiple sugar transport system permease protein
MAASTLLVIPVVAVFFAAQRTFIEGVSMTGLKG